MSLSRITRSGRSVTFWTAGSKGNAWQPFLTVAEHQAAHGTTGMISQYLARSEAKLLSTELDNTVILGAITSPSNEVTVNMQGFTGVQEICQ